ncbi:flavin dependent monooxygenase-like protein [Halenospora varia]|nr:flavin dependent monooxygenase-like protein [Halenospora varia]
MGSILRPTGRFNIQKIAIIGAGPSGLAAAKYLIAQGCFERIDILEQQSEVGGVWHYIPTPGEKVDVPSTTPHVPPEKPIWPEHWKAPLFSNPMYEHLNTNIPKGLMQFSDRPFPSKSLLFPSREDVQEYLVQYSQDVRHLISFSTQVEDVQSVPRDGKEQWNVISKSTITGETKEGGYDAVVIANGHYSTPFIPQVAGMEAFNVTYPGVITHSKIYRSPKRYTGQKVIVVGSAASGLDIGTQISLVCKKPLLNSVQSSSALKFGQENKEEVPPIVEYLLEDRSVRFEGGRVEKNIDAIVYCTGYLYSYPFLKSLDPPVITTGRRVVGLYQHLFDIAHPTLVFTALPQKVIPFPVSEAQAAAISNVWSNGLALPLAEEMEEWERKHKEIYGDGTSFHVLNFPRDAQYINNLHDWVKTATGGVAKEPPFWTLRDKWIRERFAEIRKKFAEEGSRAGTMEELGFQYPHQDEEGRARS